MWQEVVEGKGQAAHELGHPTGGVPIAFSVVILFWFLAAGENFMDALSK